MRGCVDLDVHGTSTPRTRRGVAASASYLAKLSTTNGALDTTFTPAGATAIGNLSFRSAATYGPSVMLGGYVDFCDGTVCSSGALRVNRNTRMPE